MKSFVIVHPKLGIYLGNAMGLGFFSNLDCAGQDLACIFDTEDQAREHVSGWDDNNDPELYGYVGVDVAARWATIEELEAAGLKEFTQQMRTERLINLGVAGSA